MGGFATTSVAFSVPFESEPERNNGFQSKNVQEAIEEALALAVSNDRFLILSDYGGNANAGRLLEFYPGLNSDEAPLFFDSGTNALQIVCTTTAPNSNAIIGFYDNINDPGLTTPLYQLNMGGNKRVIDNGNMGTPLFVVPQGGTLTIKVDSNSINKPHIQLILSSTI